MKKVLVSIVIISETLAPLFGVHPATLSETAVYLYNLLSEEAKGELHARAEERIESQDAAAAAAAAEEAKV